MWLWHKTNPVLRKNEQNNTNMSKPSDSFKYSAVLWNQNNGRPKNKFTALPKIKMILEQLFNKRWKKLFEKAHAQ